jgi:prepilin-type N-terminal cleavage/methylation domain-containing protein
MKRQGIKQSSRFSTVRAFTLVELLVVIGIIAILIGLLMPTISQARLQGTKVKCMANMRQIGLAMQMYAEENRGLFVPLGPLEDGNEAADTAVMYPPGWQGASANPKVQESSGQDALGNPLPVDASSPYAYMTLGTNVYPWMRWPYRIVKDTNLSPIPQQADWQKWLAPETTTAIQGDPLGTFAGPWTSKIMVCPQDPEPGAAHSYLFNQHLVQNQQKVMKYYNKPFVQNQTDSSIVLLGEKKSSKDDYYMENGDLQIDPTSASTSHVEFNRHGIKLGSNYLYKDWHVQSTPPSALSYEVDAWDIVPSQTQKSSN